MTNEVDSFDLRALPESRLREIHAFEEIMRAEAAPHDPPRPLENYIAAVQSMPRFFDVHGLVMRDHDGAIAGEAECVLVQTGENAHLAQLDISVRPDTRRQGIGRALLAAGVDTAVADERSLFVSVTNARVPAGEMFARRVGAVAVQTSHVNRLRLIGVDRSRLDGWIADGPVRASGYSLFAVDDPLPETLVDDVASLLDVMNEVPSGSSDIEDRHVTAGELREWEEQTAASGGMQWWILARHDGSDRLVGLTEVTWNPTRPHTVHQGNTGVVAEHRGHALGRWLKATMLLRILQDCSGAVDVRTNNADSNEAMVGINEQLGFSPYMAQTTWHASLGDLQEYLRGRT